MNPGVLAILTNRFMQGGCLDSECVLREFNETHIPSSGEVVDAMLSLYEELRPERPTITEYEIGGKRYELLRYKNGRMVMWGPLR